MELLSYEGGHLLIQDQKVFRLSYEKVKELENVPYKLTYPQGHGSSTGKTVLFFKTHFDLENLDEVVELPDGRKMEIYRLTYIHGSHIADKLFYKFAVIDGKVEGWCESSPWDNPQRDFCNWKQNVLKRLCTV